MVLVSRSVFLARYDKCKQCQYFEKRYQRCSLCGCFVIGKALAALSQCPAKPSRWPQVLNTLNLDFEMSCASSAERSYQRVGEYCTRISNFFAHPEKAFAFYRRLPCWDCGPLDTHLKPGADSLLPNWTPRYLLQDHFANQQLRLSHDPNHLTAVCNWLYEGAIKRREILSSYAVEGATLPHVDFVPTDEHTAYICLVNLNDHEVATDFWQFEGSGLCSSPAESQQLQNCIARRSAEYLRLPKEQRREFCASLPELRQSLRVTYQPNEAIIYPAHAYHSPAVQKRHTRSRPRLLLRMSYRVLNAAASGANAAH